MIQARSVTKRFGKLEALAGLSLSVEPGERIALIGHNGSGKTTLMRCLLGLYACEGDLKVLGLDPRSDRQQVLAEVGFVPQQAPGIRAPVGEYLRALNRLCGVEKSAVKRITDELGLDLSAIESKAFHALSGGMKQKLLISVALARRPRLLIMDEPAANLDPVARAAFFQALWRVGQDSTVILSSHRVDEVSELVTRLVELDSGRVVLDDVVSVDHARSQRQLRVEIGLRQHNAHVVDALRQWGLAPAPDQPDRWSGQIAGADRFRFLCAVARWSGAVTQTNIQENEDDVA